MGANCFMLNIILYLNGTGFRTGVHNFTLQNSLALDFMCGRCAGGMNYWVQGTAMHGSVTYQRKVNSPYKNL
jgi:hypothetical protein